MNARFALSIACTALALGSLLAACASGEGTTQPGSEDGSVDSTNPEDAGGEGGGGNEAAPGMDGARADASGDADATVPDAGAGDGKADGGDADATMTDGAAADTGALDSTVDAGAGDASADTSAGDVEADGTADSGGDAAADSGADADADAGAQDAPAESAVDTGADTGSEAGTDAAGDTGSDAGQDTGAGLGPVCQHPDGGNYFCNAGEHCCGNAVTRDSNCGTSCDDDAGYYPVDCPGASGDGGCGSLICCATLVINGGTVPDCNPTELTSSCATTCNDNPPGALSGCVGSYTIRLCTAAADCANDPNGNNYCCNFGAPASPVNWCVSAPLTIPGLANSCL